ncbi:LamG domain-containing protein [bacterium]|nr:LamG domain-containing protein [bacterium]
MANDKDLSIYGKADWIFDREPTNAEENVQIDDLWVNYTTGLFCVCTDDTPDNQVWKCNDTFDYSEGITSPNNNFLSAFYSFDDINGASVNDGSLNTNHATIVGAPVAVTGRDGNGFDFDGVDDYLIVPNTVCGNAKFGISFYVKLNSLASDAMLFYIEDVDSPKAAVLYDTTANELQAFIGSDTPSTVAPAGTFGSVVADTWYHVCFTGNTTETKFYVDKALQHTFSLGHDITLATTLYTIATEGNNLVQYADIVLDHYKHFNKYLVQAEVSQLADEFATSPTGIAAYDHPDLAFIYLFNSDATDSSPAVEHGTEQGGVTYDTGIIGSAAELGGGKSIDVPYTFSGQEGAFSFWYYRDSSNDGLENYIFAASDDTGDDYGILIKCKTDNKIRLEIRTATGLWVRQQSFAFSLDTWHHFVIPMGLTNSEGFFKMDGADVATGFTNLTFQWWDDIPNPIVHKQLGLWERQGSTQSNGVDFKVDKFRYFTRPITVPEASVLYNSGIGI